ncbi:hypothetical protein [Homoserinibacter sp. GY 40078]|uniref:hypothetical protein n=1 Tax=Homoserinibacter sp. GY 40078 TaxID=2603275 RepID=UPI0011CA1984|nr:hypothetical protein [Homoserinibacter sp. GY 40078]TXK17057.1 hypothetical protein FVQ89_09245 [Homoserinibacter sp. GY 40078]
MPRSHRPRRRGHEDEPEPLDLERILGGARRTEAKRDGVWNVQPQSAASAVKEYICPGCALAISPGTPHLVTWQADGMFGDEAALADRRHWHTHCWRIRA